MSYSSSVHIVYAELKETATGIGLEGSPGLAIDKHIENISVMCPSGSPTAEAMHVLSIKYLLL